jgi:hypothetical protein
LLSLLSEAHAAYHTPLTAHNSQAREAKWNGKQKEAADYDLQHIIL